MNQDNINEFKGIKESLEAVYNMELGDTGVGKVAADWIRMIGGRLVGLADKIQAEERVVEKLGGSTTGDFWGFWGLRKLPKDEVKNRRRYKDVVIDDMEWPEVAPGGGKP